MAYGKAQRDTSFQEKMNTMARNTPKKNEYRDPDFDPMTAGH